LIWLILCNFDLYLITNSGVVQIVLKQLFSLICVKCVIIFFTFYHDGRLCTEHSRNWYAAIFCCRGWLD